MKMKTLKLKNFRSYKDEISVDFCDLTAFVGKNDIGKSTILEALDIFFNEGKGVIKIDKDDINKQAAQEGNTDIFISVCFEDLPKDKGNHTDLDIPDCGLFCDIEMAGLPIMEIEEVRERLIK